MDDMNGAGDDDLLPVVPTPGGPRRSIMRGTMLVVAGALVWLATAGGGGPDRTSLAPAASEPASTTADTRMPESATTTEPSPEPTDLPSLTTAAPASSNPAKVSVGPKGGPNQIADLCSAHPPYPPTVPNVVGRQWSDLIPQDVTTNAIYYSMCANVSYVMFRQNVVGTECTTDPAMVGSVASQGAAVGTPIPNGEIQALDLVMYELCTPVETETSAATVTT